MTASTPTVGECRARRLRELADAHRRVETARTPDSLEDAVADRTALEGELCPLTEQDCAIVDRRLVALRAAARRRAEEASAA